MENIIEEAKKGNPRAQNEICKIIRPKLLGFCRGLTGCIDLAEDLTQETLLVVIGKIKDFSGEGSIISWANRIARNRFIDDKRRNESRSLRIADAVSSMEEHTDPEFYTKIDREDSAKKISRAMEAIKGLPPKIQEVFVLHYVEGVKHKEISEMLGINEGTSKSQCFKGKEKMKAILEKELLFLN